MGKKTGAKRTEDSGCNQPLNSENPTGPTGGIDAIGAKRPDSISLKPNMANGWMEEIAANKKLRHVIIALVVILIVVTGLIIAVTILAVKIQSLSSLDLASQNVPCTDSWFTYNGKYFYIEREEKDWSMSLKTCSLLNSSLAVIDTQKELDFWVHFLGPFDYWFGLSRETNKVWKWVNGTEFTNQFPIHGEGFCAYINAEGASSAKCTVKKGFLCSSNKLHQK